MSALKVNRMKWEGNRESDNVEDRRSGDDGGGGGGGGLGGLFGGRSLGIGTIVVALLGGWIFGINPLTILSLLSGGTQTAQVQQAPAHRPPADDRMARFVATVLADTEDVWKEEFAKGGGTYREPRLVLFRGATATACGQGQAAMGPFYCPSDQRVYIDLGFYETLQKKLGAPGDFAQAYVIAHEVGHHVQNLMGISGKMEQMRGRVSDAGPPQGAKAPSGGSVAARAASVGAPVSQVDYNRLSVRLELQADCFAGVWAHNAQNTRQILEQGDVEEAMNAAARIGDDALQRAGGGAVVPESFTHGSSAQRQRWFNTGLQRGSVKACDTFSARNL